MELMKTLESARKRRLKDVAVEMGRTTNVGEDDAWLTTPSVATRLGLAESTRRFVIGEYVRDYVVRGSETIWWPFSDVQVPSWLPETHPLPAKVLWSNRTLLRQRTIFGKTFAERGRPWYDHLETYPARLRTDRFITYPEVASHNHFVLTRGEFAFKQTAPVIKLRDDAKDSDYTDLLGILNSSSALFWMRQVCKAKGGAADKTWSRTYQFNTTTIQEMPLPAALPTERGAVLDKCASQMAKCLPTDFDGVTPTRELLADLRADYMRNLGRLIAHQEELDWEVYRLYGLVGDDFVLPADDLRPLPSLAPGQRAFEIGMAGDASLGSGRWFEDQGATPEDTLPGDWPDHYRSLVERRVELIRNDPRFRLLESPNHKRPWLVRDWDAIADSALRAWILRRISDARFWFDGHGRPTVKSHAVLADAVGADESLATVIELWEGRPDVPVVSSLGRLLSGQAVPYLAAHRYNESGMRKRSAWESVWALQRREDAGTYNDAPKSYGGEGSIPLPPKYAHTDFLRPDYWSHRGKLDVPREPFVLYPGAGRDGDPTPVIGWGGWDHAQQALALATLIQSGEQQGWSDERLTPLVAGMSELLPWVEQWHTDPDPLYGGGSPAEFFSGLLDNYMAKLGTTRESLAAWRPPAAKRGRKAKS
jgi:hypothetical protein